MAIRRQSLPAGVLCAMVAALAMLLVAVCVRANHRFFYDDAFITLRYAKHVLMGLGPMWNTQGPRVEGFTSPLHVLLIAVVARLGVPLMSAPRLLNVTCHVALVAFVFVYLRRRVGLFAAALGAMLLAASWMLVVWDLGGLDEVLYACLNTIGVLTGLRYLEPEETHPRRALLLGMLSLGLGALARPEGALMMVGLWLAVVAAPARTQGSKVRMLLLSAAVGIAVVLPLVLFRWFYFHQIAPNTMYAKVGGISRMQLIAAGAGYVARFLFAPPFVGLMALGAAAVCLLRRRMSTVDAGMWWFLALMALGVIALGGDYMLVFRFCIPMYCLLAIVLVRHLSALGWLQQGDLQLVLVGLLFTAMGLQTRMDYLNPRYPDATSVVGTHVGEYIRDHWKPESVVALNTAGSTPYVADSMEYIDMLGLNDLAIARRKDVPREGPWLHTIGHLKGDAASVLARHPDYIIVGPADGTTVQRREKVFFLGDYELANSAEFLRDYHACSVALADDITFTFYKKVSLGNDCP